MKRKCQRDSWCTPSHICYTGGQLRFYNEIFHRMYSDGNFCFNKAKDVYNRLALIMYSLLDMDLAYMAFFCFMK